MDDQQTGSRWPAELERGVELGWHSKKLAQRLGCSVAEAVHLLADYGMAHSAGPAVAARLIVALRDGSITEQIMGGMSASEIADHYGVSVLTLHVYWYRSFEQKLARHRVDHQLPKETLANKALVKWRSLLTDAASRGESVSMLARRLNRDISDIYLAERKYGVKLPRGDPKPGLGSERAKEFQRRLIAARETLGLSQADMAARLRTSLWEYNAWEYGVKVIRVATLAAAERMAEVETE